MLKSINSNNSPGHLHNGHSSVVGLSFDSCPGNISKEDNKMRRIGDTFHFKGYVWEIVDKWQGGYALQRKTKKYVYDYNGWVNEKYGVFEIDQSKPEHIKRPRYKTCEHCNTSWDVSHFCKVLNSPERVKARQQRTIARYGRLV